MTRRGVPERGRTEMRSTRLKSSIQAVIVVLALTVATGVAVGAADTLVWDIAAGPQYVDPVMGTSAQANVMVLQNVYERLVVRPAYPAGKMAVAKQGLVGGRKKLVIGSRP